MLRVLRVLRVYTLSMTSSFHTLVALQLYTLLHSSVLDGNTWVVNAQEVTTQVVQDSTGTGSFGASTLSRPAGGGGGGGGQRMSQSEEEEEQEESFAVTAITYNVRRSYVPPQDTTQRLNARRWQVSASNVAWIDPRAATRMYTDAKGGSAASHRGLLGWDDAPPHNFARRATEVVRTALTPPPNGNGQVDGPSIRAPADFVALQEADPTQRAAISYAAARGGWRTLADYGHFAMNPLLFRPARWKLLRSGWAQASSTPWKHDNCGPNGQAAPRAGSCDRQAHGGAVWGRHVQWAVFAPRMRNRFVMGEATGGRVSEAAATNITELLSAATSGFVPYWDAARMAQPSPPDTWRDSEWRNAIAGARASRLAVLVINVHWPLTASKVLPAMTVASVIANVTRCMEGACGTDAASNDVLSSMRVGSDDEEMRPPLTTEVDAATIAAAALPPSLRHRRRRRLVQESATTRVVPVVLGDFNAIASDAGVLGLQAASRLKDTYSEAVACGVGGELGRRCPGPVCATNDAWNAAARSARLLAPRGTCPTPHFGSGKIDHVLVGTDGTRVTGAGVVPCGGVAGDPLACASDHQAVWARFNVALR